MQIHYTGYRIRGFYRVAHSGYVWGMTSKHAQHRLAIGAFCDRHGKIAASEAFKVSIRTRYRWRQTLNHHAGNAAALTPESCTPHRRRRPTTPPALCRQTRQLRRHYPNLGKARLRVLLRDWCAQQQLPLPVASNPCPAHAKTANPTTIIRHETPLGGMAPQVALRG